MNTLIVVFLIAASATNASVIGLGGSATLVGPGRSGVVLKGPSAQAALIGPDGSSIVSAADTGAVAAAPLHGGAVSTALASGVVAAAPTLIASTPVVAPVPAVVAAKVGTVIDGPSGIIRTNGNPFGLIAAVPSGVAIAPAAATIAGPAHLGLGYGLGLSSHGLWI